MLIVSDTSPITNLIRIDKLFILEKLFKEIIIPQHVYKELSDYEDRKEVIDSQSWIKIKPVENYTEVERLSIEIDLGEAEAIVLAKELKAKYLIIDERKGRKIAEDEGIKIVGLLGVLMRARQAGHIDELKPVISKLIEGGFRIHKELVNWILSEVGENID